MARSPRPRPGHRRAFSVLEFAIALSIAGVAVATAASLAVGLARSMRPEKKRAQVDSDARRLVDFLVGSAQVAGGRRDATVDGLLARR